MSITIEPISLEEIPVASAVMGQAFLTSPMNVAAFGPDLDRNVGRMRAALERLTGQAFVAKDDGQIVGAMKMVEWPDCRSLPWKMLPMMPFMLIEDGVSIINIFKWKLTWAKMDPKEPHWHFGPIGVLPERQGQGIGSRLLTQFCELVDEQGAAAYLETDKAINVTLYQRFGFEVTSEAPILGVPNWFMWRSPPLKA